MPQENALKRATATFQWRRLKGCSRLGGNGVALAVGGGSRRLKVGHHVRGSGADMYRVQIYETRRMASMLGGGRSWCDVIASRSSWRVGGVPQTKRGNFEQEMRRYQQGGRDSVMMSSSWLVYKRAYFLSQPVLFSPPRSPKSQVPGNAKFLIVKACEIAAPPLVTTCINLVYLE